MSEPLASNERAGDSAKRGARKAFREHLNVSCRGIPKHRHNRYQQKTREYGDYLYHQDRDMFEVEFDLAMEGKSPGFDHTKWVTNGNS